MNWARGVARAEGRGSAAWAGLRRRGEGLGVSPTDDTAFGNVYVFIITHGKIEPGTNAHLLV